jgi:hypothetical protein
LVLRVLLRVLRGVQRRVLRRVVGAKREGRAGDRPALATSSGA